LGIINGGLGIWLANPSMSIRIAYGAVAGVVWAVWMLIAIVSEIRRSRANKRAAKKTKTVS
jgi:hypothetical protein